MSRRARSARIAGWVPAIGWLGAALLLGLWLTIPAVSPEPLGFAWSTGLAAVLAALTYVAVRAHGHGPLPSLRRGRHPFRPPVPANGDQAPRPLGAHVPRWYRGRSHSGGRPEFD